MLKALSNDLKTKADASSKTAEPLPEQEQFSQLMGGMGRSRQSQPLQQRENVAALQKTYGNQAVLRMSRGERLRSSSMNPTQRSLLQRKCACGNAASAAGTCGGCQEKQGLSLQTKLRISEPGDEYEQETDRVAEKIMTMPDRSASTVRKPALQEAKNKGTFEAEQNLENRLNNSGSGSPLPNDVRAFMEPRFSADFSDVRVHTGSNAIQMNQDLNAQAFTHRRDIYFGVNQSPGKDVLTAHELTHVMQQTGGVQTMDSSLHIHRQNNGSLDGGSDGAGQQQQQQDGSTGGSSIIYICSKNLETSPIGKHAFFRIGGAGRGNPTKSLEPVDRGADCWQGQPMYDFPADVSADATCEAISITESCLSSQFTTYPIGHYCTLGPNSNTLVGTLAQNCGMKNPDPPGFTPGIYDKPPLPGTFAPSPMNTLFSCSLKICDASRETPPNEIPA